MSLFKEALDLVRHILNVRQLEREAARLKAENTALKAENEKLKAQIDQIEQDPQANQKQHPANNQDRLRRLNYDPYKDLPH